MTKVAVLLTIHNRKEVTLHSLEKIQMQEGFSSGEEISIIVVDDGCTDGSCFAIKKFIPKANIIQGTGNLYWNGGMRLAFGTALGHHFDFYLWLNDDTLLFPDAIKKLLNTSIQTGNKSIIVGSLQDPMSGHLTYGGLTRKQCGRKLNFSLVEPANIPMEVETMHGNCVLIPQTVAQAVGNLDPSFTHGMGDYDYGLRARKLGYSVTLAPGYFGTSQKNPLREIWQDKSLPFSIRWKNLVSIQGLPPREWAIFSKRYAGIFWWLFWLSPYFRTFFSCLFTRVRKEND
jgi:GT2 family glycosyltransferase